MDESALDKSCTFGFHFLIDGLGRPTQASCACPWVHACASLRASMHTCVPFCSSGIVVCGLQNALNWCNDSPRVAVTEAGSSTMCVDQHKRPPVV